MDEFRRIYYSFDVLVQNKEMLINYYVSQYGEGSRSIIQERSAKTIYLLDSPPDITFQYLIQNQNYADPVEIENFEELSNDYCYLNRLLTEQEEEEFFDTFSYYHNLSYYECIDKREQVLSIINLLKSSRSMYSELCRQAYFPVIQDEEKFKQFREEILEIKRVKQINLLNQSLWGKNVRKSLLDIGIKLKDDAFSYLFRLDKKHVARCINFSPYIFVYVPIIQLYLNGGYVDRVFFHENRHAIESGSHYKVGLAQDTVHYFNEIRTEKHAMEDNQVLPTLFSKDGSPDIQFYYEEMLPYLGDLLEEYGSYIDQCAFSNDLEKFLCIFGEKDLKEYLNILNHNYYDFYATGKSMLEVNLNDCLDRVEQLKKNAKQYLKK